MNEKFFILPEEKRIRILNAGLRCFANSGYQHTLTDDIAAQAGISKGLLFHYFVNKRSLYEYLFQYSLQYVGERLREFYVWEGDDLFEIISRSSRLKAEIMGAHPYIFQFVINAYYDERGDISPKIKTIYGDIVNRSIAMMVERVDRAKLKPGVDFEQLLHIILWCAEGFMLQRHREGTLNDLEDVCEKFERSMQELKRVFYKEEYL